MKKLLLLVLFNFFSCSSSKQTIQNEIKGTVVNIDNTPIKDVEIQFYNDGNDFGFVPKKVTTNENGLFVVKKVTVKGDYRISKMLSDKLPSKIIFKKQGYLSDTIKIADYSNVKKDEVIMIQIQLKKP